MNWATLILSFAALYAGTGVMVGAAFIAFGVQRVDAAAVGSPWLFRLLIWPGAAALWPVVAVKWARAGSRGPGVAHGPSSQHEPAHPQEQP